MGILIGGLIYVPLCLFEIRMSPQLHKFFYGYHAFSDFAQTMRFGGWRPTVFMSHGLMVGMWMSMAALVAVWMWWTKAVRTIMGIPMWVAVPALVITAVLCKSTGALILMACGLAALAVVKTFNARVLIWILIVIAPLYIVVRVTKVWDGTDMVSVARMISDERAQSLGFRLQNENLLVDKAMLQPIFGWGGWNRSQIIDKQTGFRTVVDGQWINSLGLYGLVGMISLTAMLLMPPAIALRRFGPASWASPAFAAAAALLMINVLYMLDNIPNAMVNPLYVLAAGGLTGILLNKAPVPIPVPRTVATANPQKGRVTRVAPPRVRTGAFSK